MPAPNPNKTVLRCLMKIAAVLALFGIFHFHHPTPSLPPPSKLNLFTQTVRSVIKLSFPYMDENGGGTHFCTGFIVNAPRGWALTARHCVPDDDAPLTLNDADTTEV